MVYLVVDALDSIKLCFESVSIQNNWSFNFFYERTKRTSNFMLFHIFKLKNFHIFSLFFLSQKHNAHTIKQNNCRTILIPYFNNKLKVSSNFYSIQCKHSAFCPHKSPSNEPIIVIFVSVGIVYLVWFTTLLNQDFIHEICCSSSSTIIVYGKFASKICCA